MMRIRNQTGPGSLELLNRAFFEAESPASYFITRMQVLLAIAGTQQEQMVGLLTSELQYAGIGLKFGPSASKSQEDQEAESKRLIDQFVRVESHLLKHHVIETLLRHYLANLGNPSCPWVAISAETSFRRFKSNVQEEVLNKDPGELVDNVAWLFLGVRLEGTGAERLTRIAENLSRFLKTFARDWLETATAYNSSKHGMTAIPDEVTFSIHEEGGSPVELGFGDSLTFLEHTQCANEWRKWSKTTEWLPARKTILTIFFGAKMLESLWGVSGVRAGSIEGFERFSPDPDKLTPDVLDSPDAPSAKRLSFDLFEEKVKLTN